MKNVFIYIYLLGLICGVAALYIPGEKSGIVFLCLILACLLFVGIGHTWLLFKIPKELKKERESSKDSQNRLFILFLTYIAAIFVPVFGLLIYLYIKKDEVD